MDEENEIINLSYYYNDINREKSEEILRLINRPGYFLIRKYKNNFLSSIKIPYVLSMINSRLKISHYLLYKINEKYYLIPYSNNSYKSIKDLIEQHKLTKGILSCTLIEYTNNNQTDSFIIPSNKLIRQQIIGQGHFGIVYKGLLNENISVAIKTISTYCSLSLDECQSNMLYEAEIMLNLVHPYLVYLYGITYYDNKLCLITEYISNGSLLFWLQKQLLITNILCHRLELFSFQICDAMSYLESKSIIHRDLAARNCLIDDHANIVKVSDFGMARLISSSSSMIYEGKCDKPFPLRWSSPEVLIYRKYSSKSDVWAYGILLWEIYSLGKMPFGESVPNEFVVQLIKSNSMPTKPHLANKIIYKDIISPCWISKPNCRPSFASLKRTFNKIIHLSSTSNSLH